MISDNEDNKDLAVFLMTLTARVIKFTFNYRKSRKNGGDSKFAKSFGRRLLGILHADEMPVRYATAAIECLVHTHQLDSTLECRKARETVGAFFDERTPEKLRAIMQQLERTRAGKKPNAVLDRAHKILKEYQKAQQKRMRTRPTH